jgi:hypothetical protein
MHHIVAGQLASVKRVRVPGPPPSQDAAATWGPNRRDASSEHTHHFERVVVACALDRLLQELVFVHCGKTFPRDIRALAAASPLDEGNADVQRQTIEIPDATDTGCQCRGRAGLWWMLRAACGSRQKSVHDESFEVCRRDGGVACGHAEDTSDRRVRNRRRTPRVGQCDRGPEAVPREVRWCCAGTQRYTEGERDVR